VVAAATTVPFDVSDTVADSGSLVLHDGIETSGDGARVSREY
jgi:hypothetical protein